MLVTWGAGQSISNIVRNILLAFGATSSTYMLASSSIVPNFRANTADPATLPAQRYHVSSISFNRPLWVPSNLIFAWQNSYTNNTGATPAEIDPPTSITVRAAVFNGNTFLSDITFAGLSEVTIASGGIIWCDPIPYSSLPSSGQLFIRTYSALPDGGQRPGRRQTTDNAAGYSSTALRTETVQATALGYLASSTITSNSGYPNSYAFGPICQAADNWDGSKCVLVVGDSIAAGNDNAIGKSWITDGLESATGGVMSYYNMAIHGTKPSNQSSDATYGRKASIIDSLTALNGGTKPMTHIISEMGVNDASGTNVASLQAKMQTWLDYIYSKWPTKLIQTTYTPRVTPDAATLQTDAAVQLTNTITPAGADRWGVADWIKTNPSPISGHIDVRAAWTGAVDGTTWAIPSWSAVLTANAAVGATSIQVDIAPPSGIIPVISPGSSATIECTAIPIGAVSGTGPYTIALNKALTKSHLLGAAVKATPSVDGLHPEEGYMSDISAAVVASEKVNVINY